MSGADHERLRRRIGLLLSCAVGLLLLSGLLPDQAPPRALIAAGWWWLLLSFVVSRQPLAPARDRLRTLLSWAAAGCIVLFSGPGLLFGWLLRLWAVRAEHRFALPVALLSSVLWLREAGLVGEAAVTVAATGLWLVLLAAAGGYRLLRGRLPRRVDALLLLLIAVTVWRASALAVGWWPLSLAVIGGALLLTLRAAWLVGRVRTPIAAERLLLCSLTAMLVLLSATGSEAALTVALVLPGLMLVRDRPLSRIAGLTCILPLVWSGAAALVTAGGRALVPLWCLAWWWLSARWQRADAPLWPAARRQQLLLLGGTALTPWLAGRLAEAAAQLSAQAAPFGTLRAGVEGSLLLLNSGGAVSAALPIWPLAGSLLLIWAGLQLTAALLEPRDA